LRCTKLTGPSLNSDSKPKDEDSLLAGTCQVTIVDVCVIVLTTT